MFTILAKQNLNQNVKRLDIRADALVGKIKPGHFVAVMPDAFSRRMAFSVFEVDWRRKCLSIVFEENDIDTRKMGEMKINDPLFAVSGPFGSPLAIEKKGAVVCVGEGLGLVSLVSLCRALKQVGNKVIAEHLAGSILRQKPPLHPKPFLLARALAVNGNATRA